MSAEEGPFLKAIVDVVEVGPEAPEVMARAL